VAAGIDDQQSRPRAMKPSSNQKLMLRFRDRVGIVADLSARIAGLGMNIASMEVQRRDDEAHVYL
jgi:hypothetical protein